MASSSAAGGKAERGNAARGRGKDGANLEGGSLKRKRGLFNKDLRLMMYGFGDDPDPIPETVELVEDILINYITDMVHKSAEVASRRGKLQTDDLVFLIRKDVRKFARVKELLHMHKELKRARKAFEVDEEKFKDEAVLGSVLLHLMKNADIRKWFVRQNGKEAPSQAANSLATAKQTGEEDGKKAETAVFEEREKKGKGDGNIVASKDTVALKQLKAVSAPLVQNGSIVTPEKKPLQQTKPAPQKVIVEGMDAARAKRKSTHEHEEEDRYSDEDDEEQDKFDGPLPKKHRGGTGTGRGAPGAAGGAAAGGRGGRGGWGGGRGAFFGQPRAAPPHKGEKEIPEGDETCLKGLTFVISGTLDSLEREEAEVLIKSHGGRVTTSVSKKTNFLLADEDVGGRKSQKAKELGIKFLTEDKLFDMIRASAKKPVESWKASKATDEHLPLAVTAEQHLPPKPVHVQNSDKAPCEDRGKAPLLRQGIDQGRGGSKGAGDADVVRGLVPHNKGVVESERWKADGATTDPRVTDAASAAWPLKYAPKNFNELVGNQSLVKQLHDWLQSWERYHLHGGAAASEGAAGRGRGRGAAKKVGSSSSGPDFDKKAALLSGPPGIGKTTTAKLVCEALGMDVVEVNASDNRSKADTSVLKGIGGKMSNAVKEMVNNKPLSVTEGGQQARRMVLIMDEVDGMSGGDRGGIADLILTIRASRIPIVCICNDRYSPKLKSLTNHCMHLLYRRPTKQQMAKRLQQIAVKEGMKVDDIALEELGERVNGDMRSALNQLQYMSLKSKVVKFADMRTRLMGSAKDEDLTAFTAIDKLFSFDGGRMRLDQRQDLAMVDPDLVPLMAAENYVNYRPSLAGRDDQGTKRMELIAKAADSISVGDIVNKQVRRSQTWALMPFGAFTSTINVAAMMHGQRESLVQGQYMNRFPAWLGKNSTSGKNKRLLDDVHVHMMASGACKPTKEAVRLDYMFTLVDRLVKPLRECDKVVAARMTLDFMEEYALTDEDMQAILEMVHSDKKAMDGVPPQTKAQFTREYKARLHERRIKSADLAADLMAPGGKGKAQSKHKLRPQLEEAEPGLSTEDGDDAELFAAEDANETEEEGDGEGSALTEQNGGNEFVKIEINTKVAGAGGRAGSKGGGRGGGGRGRGTKRKDLPAGGSSRDAEVGNNTPRGGSRFQPSSRKGR
ncbi:hypothetical protein CBR_g31434 [Chara braunii]|uniref:BRCT domain-containing protein n=1 Tax=Chara braunii TaxID=69332 RepID=A0A388LEZ9_CHABU|nr:hypothetical protein CBR_g31434 [Chara braunii]|eukprot:GBG80878.1 hypothetical protein CBR_g31434 [Chara braunii]